MDRISKYYQMVKGFGGLRIWSLCFVIDVDILHLPCLRARFSAGKGWSSHSRSGTNCHLKYLSKYLSGLVPKWVERGAGDWGWFVAASSLMLKLYRYVVVCECKSDLRPILFYGNELWIVTERIRSWIQTAKMSFLWRLAGLSLTDSVSSSESLEGLRVQLLFSHIKRS